MKQILIFILLFPFSRSIAQMPDHGLYNIHITDSGKNVRTQVIPFSGTIHPRAGLLYYWFGNNSVHEQQGGYSGKLLNGIYEESDKNHHLLQQGTFRNGLKDGIWKTWAESGRLTSIITWEAGIKTGKFTYFDNNGTEIQSGMYDLGQMDGKIIYYRGTDSAKTVVYKNGKIIPARKGNFLKRINIFKKEQKEKVAQAPKP